MKNTALKIGFAISTLLMTPSLWAGIEKFDSSEFNSIISDNLTAEKDLRDQLGAETGIPNVQKEIDPRNSENAKKVVGIWEEENIVSPTSDHFHVPRKDKSRGKLDAKSLKRLSQEINTLNAE